MKQIKPIFIFCLVIVSMALLPGWVWAQAGGQAYIVQADDSLWKLAEKYLGDGNRFNEIVAATQAKRTQDPTFAAIQNPGLIFSGSKLWIPDTAASSGVENQPASAPTDPQAPASPAPQASTDGPGGQIAFSFWNNAADRCTYEINIIDVQACLTNPEACQANRRIFALDNASEPALSPDGTRLAFRGWGEIPEKYKEEQLDHPYHGCPDVAAQRRLGHTGLDATDYRGVTDYWEDAHPDWSPSGDRLLFDTGRNGDGITRLMVAGADGAYADELRIAGEQPSWAPDGERFVYRGCDLTGNRCGLWLGRPLPVQAWDLGLNMIGPVLEEPEAAHPDWSPVSDQIVYQSPVAGSWDLYLIEADGSQQRPLTTAPGREGLPVWSPNGQWIAYLSDAGGGWGLWLIRADGAERQLLFPFDGGQFDPLAITPYYQRSWLDEQISWSR